jgi:hypothetical protein
MRLVVALSGLIALASPIAAQKPNDPFLTNRWGVDPDLDGYPQSSPKVALQSVLRAGEAGRFDYIVAQLSDPAYSEKQVKDLGTFEKFVAVVKQKWNNDPETIKELRRFASDGVWEETGDAAMAKLKDVKARQVYMKKIGNRWFLENRTKPQAPPQQPRP